MKTKSIIFAFVAILALTLSACTLGASAPVDNGATQNASIIGTLTAEPSSPATAAAVGTRSAALTAESAPSATPTNTPVPTFTATIAPTNTPLPTFTTVPPIVALDPYAWVQADTPYSNETSMDGGDTFNGPAVCEWWDHKGFAFKAIYDPGTVSVNVTELHEAMFYLLEGESYTYPAGYVGKCWTIDGGDVAIAGLMDSYRHLLFFSNVYGNDSDQIKTLKSEGKIWEGMVVDGKEVHIYMHTWLEVNGLGACNFRDQTSCNILALVIVQPPLGTSIE